MKRDQRKFLFTKQRREIGEHGINESLAGSEMVYLVFSATQDRKKSGGKTTEDN